MGTGPSGYYPPLMEPHAVPGAEGTAPPVPRAFPLWPLCLLGLLAWQAWMTLSLFGTEAPWERLTNDQPILSGRHPLHLYHGYLGARSLRAHGSLCCYDPAFQAGYPKTPIFDSGSRLAELFLTLGGGAYRPAAYKIGLAICCLAVPLLLVVAARGVGLGGGCTCLATLLGLLVCWGTPGRSALEAGDLDLFMAALAVLAQFGLLVRFDRRPGPGAWLGIFLCGCLGWLANHLLFATLFPLVLLYYLSVGARHRFLGWHAALLAGLMGGLLLNAFWLVDWVKHWWIRSPLPLGESLLAHRTFETIWNAPLWGDSVDRCLAMVLLGGAVLGTLVLNQCKRRAAARLLGLGAGSLVSLAVLGIAVDALGQLGTPHLLVPGLWFATLPAAHALSRSLALLRRWLGSSWATAGLVGGSLAVLAGTAPESLETLGGRLRQGPALVVGLGTERLTLVETLKVKTGTEARILWEDNPSCSRERWTSLLPVLTGRYFLGGLDPDAGIEHGYAALVDQNLAGRHLGLWSNEELEDFCRRYNVGWVVCWSPASRDRFLAWAKDRANTSTCRPGLPVPLHDGRPGWLFPLERARFSYVLNGARARLIHADCEHITLADVAPADGTVVLSLHYQEGLRASPSRVQVEREPDANDPIPFIRLRVARPVARLTLTWDAR